MEILLHVGVFHFVCLAFCCSTQAKQEVEHDTTETDVCSVFLEKSLFLAFRCFSVAISVRLLALVLTLCVLLVCCKYRPCWRSAFFADLALFVLFCALLATKHLVCVRARSPVAPKPQMRLLSSHLCVLFAAASVPSLADRSELLAFISHAIGSDRVAAEMLLAHMVSRMYAQLVRCLALALFVCLLRCFLCALAFRGRSQYALVLLVAGLSEVVCTHED